MKVLVTGGVRSGKSRHAEELLSAYDGVTYVAPGPTIDEDTDPDWAARIHTHRERRRASWATLETRDLSSALAVPGPLLVDCLGTWLTAVLDAGGLWDVSSEEARGFVDAELGTSVAALGAAPGPVVLVTNEVGLGVVPEHRSGRLFRDLLGTVNQTMAAACDEVHLVVAGRVLVL
ncbi:MAG: bifunctional adenosylcobinamide kinase/adenosylcobinamide-phosphate guanylyltransferase [Marmoricola sp.]|nr:bifunctional adenosylcobinamide kinase/adenosylcobinamide-phosphate guanylyltransferase [Marmoricola sp.]